MRCEHGCGDECMECDECPRPGPPDYGVPKFFADVIRAEGAAARQAAIVAWLRSVDLPVKKGPLVDAADAIEAGAVDGGGA